MQHALDFCKACSTHYGATTRDRIPTISAGVFASIPSASDKAWAAVRVRQLCPTLQTAPPPAVQSDNATAIAAAAGLNAQMLEMMKEMMATKKVGSTSGVHTTEVEAKKEMLKTTWHGKLGMSKSVLWLRRPFSRLLPSAIGVKVK